MDSTVLVAIVGAVSAILGALASAYVTRRNHNASIELERSRLQEEIRKAIFLQLQNVIDEYQEQLALYKLQYQEELGRYKLEVSELRQEIERLSRRISQVQTLEIALTNKNEEIKKMEGIIEDKRQFNEKLRDDLRKCHDERATLEQELFRIRKLYKITP